MTLRDVLISRIERRADHGKNDRREQSADLRAGRPATVTCEQLASALWEQGAINAEQLSDLKTSQDKYWTVEEDSSYSPTVGT
ncbi:MAG: hypothetical protein WD757_00595 [Actinomycetota bacterium]